jgi:hypothetical protein
MHASPSNAHFDVLKLIKGRDEIYTMSTCFGGITEISFTYKVDMFLVPHLEKSAMSSLG